MKGVVDIIKSLLEELDIRLRWVAVVGVSILVLIVLLALECATGFVYYRSLERKVELLKTLHSLSEGDITQNQDLYPLYQETVEELSRRKVNPLLFPSLASADPRVFWKAVSGAFIWLLLLIPAPFGAYGEETKVIATVFFIFCVVLFGCIGAIIPTANCPWMNYLGFPAVQIVIFFLVARKLRKK